MMIDKETLTIYSAVCTFDQQNNVDNCLSWYPLSKNCHPYLNFLARAEHEVILKLMGALGFASNFTSDFPSFQIDSL